MPESAPSFLTTRGQGIATAILLAAHAACDGCETDFGAQSASYSPHAGGLTSGNFPQRLPDTLLNTVPRKSVGVRGQSRDVRQADDIRDDCFEARSPAEQIRSWKSVLEIADKFLWIVAEKDEQTPFWLRATRIEPREHRRRQLDVRQRASRKAVGSYQAPHLFRIEPAIGINRVINRWSRCLAVNKLFPTRSGGGPFRKPSALHRDLLEKRWK